MGKTKEKEYRVELPELETKPGIDDEWLSKAKESFKNNSESRFHYAAGMTWFPEYVRPFFERGWSPELAGKRAVEKYLRDIEFIPSKN
jgi:hypothetical protein